MKNVNELMKLRNDISNLISKDIELIYEGKELDSEEVSASIANLLNEYKKQAIIDELNEMVNEEGYEWFFEDTTEDDRKNIIERTADLYIEKEKHNPYETIYRSKREILDSYLANEHYWQTTIRLLESA